MFTVKLIIDRIKFHLTRHPTVNDCSYNVGRLPQLVTARLRTEATEVDSWLALQD